ncbi:MAG: hypothetical protein AB8G77_22730 [Rhodothermales bacterium]
MSHGKKRTSTGYLTAPIDEVVLLEFKGNGVINLTYRDDFIALEMLGFGACVAEQY